MKYWSVTLECHIAGQVFWKKLRVRASSEAEALQAAEEANSEMGDCPPPYAVVRADVCEGAFGTIKCGWYAYGRYAEVV